MRRTALLLALTLALTGCATTAPTTAPPELPATTSATSAPAAPVRRPVHIQYEAVGVDADTSPTGLDGQGAIEVPPLNRPAEVDYLNWDATLAAARPVVLVSHVSGRDATGKAIPGGFFRLKSAKVGDLMSLTWSDGMSAAYRVTTSRTFPKSGFPTSVYDARPQPTIVLITCGGVLDRATHSFDSNVIVTATGTTTATAGTG